MMSISKSHIDYQTSAEDLPIQIQALSLIMQDVIRHKTSTRYEIDSLQMESQKIIYQILTLLNLDKFPELCKVYPKVRSYAVKERLEKLHAILEDSVENRDLADLFHSSVLSETTATTMTRVWDILSKVNTNSSLSILDAYSSWLSGFLEYEIAFDTSGVPHYHPKGARRRILGSYFTESSLAEKLAREVLMEYVLSVAQKLGFDVKVAVDLEKLSLQDKKRISKKLWGVRILDPACGLGHLLISTSKILSELLVMLSEENIPRKKVIRHVISSCIYGVDVNPLTLLLCRITLQSMFGISAKKEHFHSGNALVGLIDANKPMHHELVTPEGFSPVHWSEIFPQEMSEGGFEIVITNPPWERIRVMEREHFFAGNNVVAMAETQSLRNELLKQLDGSALSDFNNAKKMAKDFGKWVKESGEYTLTANGEINLYQLFAERAMNLTSKEGVCGLIVPTGIATDYNNRNLFWTIFSSGSLVSLFDFENRKRLFSTIDGRMRFSLMIVRKSKSEKRSKFFFFAHKPEDLNDESRLLLLMPEDIVLFNPISKTAPVPRTKKDLALLRKIYQTFPILEEQMEEWQLRYLRMMDMSNDSKYFIKREVAVENYNSNLLRVYEGKMIDQYNHRASSSKSRLENLRRPSYALRSMLNQLQDPTYQVDPRFYVSEDVIKTRLSLYKNKRFLGFKDITSATNERTMIASILPYAAITNKIPVLLSEITSKEIACLLANLNSFVYDFSCRQKIGNITLNWYIVRQIPLCTLSTYKKYSIQGENMIDWVSNRVAELTYTATDLSEWGKSLGFVKPFAWNLDRRRELKIELDALFFVLYGMEDKEVKQVMNTFPIVRKKEIARSGKYLLEEQILEKTQELRKTLS